ncbi:MAG: SCO family protein [Pseudomonadota bacterium]|nr:SCO family protein [Pseudomonadota bacterium]
MKKLIGLIALLALGVFAEAHAETAIGGGFTLTDQNGRQVSDADFRGRDMLLFFGFTHCPDLCPTTLLVMSQVVEQLKGEAAGVAPVFISVDAGRDTPARLKEYLANFNPTIVGLTGTQPQIDAVEAEYKTYSARVEDKDAPDGYGFDHSGYIYLMDRQGKFVTVFTADSSPQTIAAKIRETLKAGK